MSGKIFWCNGCGKAQTGRYGEICDKCGHADEAEYQRVLISLACLKTKPEAQRRDYHTEYIREMERRVAVYRSAHALHLNEL